MSQHNFFHKQPWLTTSVIFGYCLDHIELYLDSLCAAHMRDQILVLCSFNGYHIK